MRTGSRFPNHYDARAEKFELVHDATAARHIASTPMAQLTKVSTGRQVAVLAAAVAALLAQPPAYAVSLGQVELLSHLGEPLRAEIPLGVAPGERVLPGCIRLATDATAGTRAGIPYEAGLRITGSGTSQRLLIDGRLPLREPIVDLAVSVNCPGTPVLERGYLLMLTPAGVAAMRGSSPAAQVSVPSTAGREGPSASAAAAAQPATSPRATTPLRESTQRPRQNAATPLRGGEPYRVAPGDTLSTIAQRVTDRQDTLWTQAEAIFAANPTAFIGGDRNRIRAGALIEIPAGATLAGSASAPPATPARAAAPVQQRDPVVTPAEVTAPATALSAPSLTSAPTAAVASTVAAQAAAPQRMGPPLPAGMSAGPQPGAPSGDVAGDTSTAVSSVPAASITAAASATAAPGVSAQAPAQRGDGLLRWLTGLLVGLGFIILGGLLAWTALRRRPQTDDVPVDLEETGRATRLAPPPSFDPGLMQTGAIDLRAHGMRVEEATDEVEVLKAGPAPGMDLDDLFPAGDQGYDTAAGTGGRADEDALDIQVDDPALADTQAASEPPQINIEGTGSFKVEDLALGRRPSGETTVEHRFGGFSDTQALELQMTEAMDMLEKDYTSRFEAAVSLDDTGSLEATDTLHGVPAEVMRSLKELEAQAEDDDAPIEDAATAILPAPEIAAETMRESVEDDAAESDDEARTALMEQPPGKVNTG